MAQEDENDRIATVFERLEVAKKPVKTRKTKPVKTRKTKPQEPSKNSKGKGNASRKLPQFEVTDDWLDFTSPRPQWGPPDDYLDFTSSDENIPSVTVTNPSSSLATGNDTVKGKGKGKGRDMPQTLVVESVDEILDATSSDKRFPSEIVSHLATYD